MSRYLRSLSVLFSLLCIIFVCSKPSQARDEKYAGFGSGEAIMTFDYQVEIRAASQPAMDEVRDKIDQQLTHLFGPMAEADIKAVPKGDQKVTNIKIKKQDARTYIASYSYKGTIVVMNGAEDTYDIVLPVNPDTIYEASAVKRGGQAYYPCTDEHYQSEGDFWYFWNPYKLGCKLVEGKDYTRIQAKIERRENTTETYPEYDRLVDTDGQITVSMLFGMDDPSGGKNPLTSKDINAENYRDIRESIINMGFTSKPWTKAEIEKVTKGASSPSPYVETLSKKFKKATVSVIMFFGPSGIDENSRAFHYFFKNGLENTSVMIYDGHSGLGGHLDLKSIEETEGFSLRPNRDRYQIYFFNSCSSYPYYNTMFFKRKATEDDSKGTKNLDIFTNGLATFFSASHAANMAVVEALATWAEGKGAESYQSLAKDIDSGNLFGINGDEDNPTSER